MSYILGQEKPPLDELVIHYGVKGMRWGVRKDRSSSGSSKIRRDKDGVRPIAKTLNDSWFGKLANRNAERYANKQAQKNLDKLNKQKVAGLDLTPQQKTGVKFVAAYMTGAAIMSTANFADSGKVRVLRNKGKRFMDGDEEGVQYKRKSSLSKKDMSEDELMKDVVSDINKNYGAAGTKMNCRRCTVAYEMRRRGYDVEATHSRLASGQTSKGMKKAVNANIKRNHWGENDVYLATGKIGEVKKTDAPKAMFDALGKQPDRSRGEVGIGWLFGGGHSVAYEIVNNKPVIFDTQRQLKIKTPEDWVKAYDIDVLATGFTRLDNKPINEGWVERWVKDND